MRGSTEITAMRRHYLIAIMAFTIALACVSSKGIGQDKSWKGELVLYVKPAKDISFSGVVDGKRVDLPFSGMTPIRVREEREEKLLIQDGHREGWVEKKDFVLAREAPAYFQRRLEAKPRDTFALFMRGLAWLDQGENDKAIKDLSKCIRLNRGDHAAYNARGLAWTAKKEFDKAILDFDEGTRLAPNDPVAFYNRALVWYGQGDFDKTIKDCNECIRLDPKYANALCVRGSAWHSIKQYDAAIKDYDEAIGLDPKNVLNITNRGNSWREKKEFAKAHRDYDEAIRLDPTYAYAYYGRGRAWNTTSDYDKAIKELGEAIRLDPKYADAFFERGFSFHCKEVQNKAIENYDEAIRLDPKQFWAYHNLALIWYAKRDYDKSLRNCEVAIRLDPTVAEAFNARGTAWCAKKEYDKAVKDFDEAIRLDAKDTLPAFNRCVALMLARRPQAVASFHAQLGDWKGDNVADVVILGHLAARMVGDDAAARSFLKDSAGKLALHWPYPVVRFLRGEMKEQELLKNAIDHDTRTYAHCVLGLDHLLNGRADQASANLRWVRDNGTDGLFAYTVAVAELDRLEKAAKSKR